jgi:glucosamine-6-phosphate deaminase
LVEKIEPRFFKTAHEGSVKVARVIKSAIEEKANKGENLVLGLATGSTPLEMYR